MKVTLRPGTRDDTKECGRIDYEAFAAIGKQHNFPPDFPNVDVATMVVSMLLTTPGYYSVVAELDGKVVGSNFLDERGPIAGIGPISVDPTVQNRTIGRQLMLNVMERAKTRCPAGVRLVQSGYHNRSLCLYTKLGFETREPLSIMQGKVPASGAPRDREVRLATDADITECNNLCLNTHGHDRAGEVRSAIERDAASVVERSGRITGYSTTLGFFGHSVAETNEDLQALIAAVKDYPGPGFLIPTRNGELFRWCLNNGLRLVYQMTLMTVGLYNEPRGAWLPSVLF